MVVGDEYRGLIMIPTVNLDTLEKVINSKCSENLDEFITIARLVVKPSGQIRSTKPKADGKAAYVWRMVVFMVSDNPQHHCMPVMADCDLRFDFEMPDMNVVGKDAWYEALTKKGEIRRNLCKHLDGLVDLIVDLVPVSQRHGLLRWNKAIYG